MDIAFATTLVGLGTSLILGFCGWLFNLVNSLFLTHFERVVSTEVMPHFTQSPELAIESNIDQLSKCSNTFELAANAIVESLNRAIRQLTDTSWGGHLEQQFVLAKNFGETSKDLLESLREIKEHQAIIANTVSDFKDTTATSVSQIEGVAVSFEKLITTSMSKISEYQASVESYKNLIGKSMGHVADYQEALRKGLENTVESFRELIGQSMGQIADYQEALRHGLENAVPNIRAESEAFKATILEYQNSQAEFVDQLADKLLNILQPIADKQEVMVQELHNLAGELEIRSALENQNQVFEGIKSQLIDNQQETVNTLSKLIDELQIRPAVEAQNQVFGRIENHLGSQAGLAGEQKALMQTLNTSIQQLQQTFSSTAADEQQRTEKLLHQISLNTITLSEKIDTLNQTMSQPGLYRWGSEIRSWFSFFRKKT